MKKSYIKPEFDFMAIKFSQDILFTVSAEDLIPDGGADGDGDSWLGDADGDA